MSYSNPFLSAWLSAANTWSGAGRSFWMAEMQRQQTAMIEELVRQMMDFWSGGWMRYFDRR